MKCFYIDMSTEQSLLAEEIIAVKELNDERFDGILVISPSDMVSQVEGLSKNLSSAIELDNGLKTEIGVIPSQEFKAKRIIFSPTGYVDPDYEDVRCFRKAPNKAIKRAIKAGVEKPLVYLQGHPQFRNAALVTLLGILEGLYVVPCIVNGDIQQSGYENNKNITCKSLKIWDPKLCP